MGEYSDRLYETIIFDDPKSRPFYYEDGKGFSDYHQEDNIYWRKYVTYDKSLGDYWDYSGFNIPPHPLCGHPVALCRVSER